ncbi:M20/M25/M40 family metallo-hydrolase [Halostagnicola sp. A-GB9-2]|uniref:M20 family metallopeptidase n=1 Tax=Halostagnicola sp. A-GB9-2 TaxID=3048066 RepID=UPI0024C065A7|nr:M20/M25/M40 family metallo-hydrolase [Halostagnicola sp. A-GB9-2]MDJ1432139.1 M20/M25/M40 family metallo-hydrolase [Halostagnicola sp. A-GB9-2]
MTVVDLTRKLASIPSHEDETAAGDFLEEWLRAETDAAVTRDEAGNVIARKRRRGVGLDERFSSSAVDGTDSLEPESLAFVGHHDVVPPDESQVADGEYVVEERDGRIYGRGAADMKGAVAAAAIAFRDCDLGSASGGYFDSSTDSDSSSDSNSSAHADADARPGELVFASFVGEEVGGTGARHAIENGFAPDYAVVGEGSTNYSGPDVTDVAVAHKGRRASTITARGAAAHASEPEAGENAIYRAADAVDAIRDLEVPTLEVAGDQLAGSLVVTEIDGGSAWNVVPEVCTITIDERTVPGERAALETVADREGVEWTIDQDLPPMQCGDHAFAEVVLEAADRSQSGVPELVTKPHATDAGWLSQAGTECVICGPSEPGEAHTKTESVSISVLERCLETYRRTAEQLI